MRKGGFSPIGAYIENGGNNGGFRVTESSVITNGTEGSYVYYGPSSDAFELKDENTGDELSLSGIQKVKTTSGQDYITYDSNGKPCDVYKAGFNSTRQGYVVVFDDKGKNIYESEVYFMVPHGVGVYNTALLTAVANEAKRIRDNDWKCCINLGKFEPGELGEWNAIDNSQSEDIDRDFVIPRMEKYESELEASKKRLLQQQGRALQAAQEGAKKLEEQWRADCAKNKSAHLLQPYFRALDYRDPRLTGGEVAYIGTYVATTENMASPYLATNQNLLGAEFILKAKPVYYKGFDRYRKKDGSTWYRPYECKVAIQPGYGDFDEKTIFLEVPDVVGSPQNALDPFTRKFFSRRK